MAGSPTSHKFFQQSCSRSIRNRRVDLSFCAQTFPGFYVFYQLVLVRNRLQVKRMEYTLPNICVVDIKTEETIRILGVYASESRSCGIGNRFLLIYRKIVSCLGTSTWIWTRMVVKRSPYLTGQTHISWLRSPQIILLHDVQTELLTMRFLTV